MELIKNKEKELEFMLRNSQSLFKLFVNTSPEDLKKRLHKVSPSAGLYELFDNMVKIDILEGVATKEEVDYLKLLQKEGLIKIIG